MSPRQPTSAPPLSAVLATWQLQAPLSRAVVVSQGRALFIAGGLQQGGQSTAGVFRVDPTSGAPTFLGSLPYPGHDAAGAMLHGRVVVFGGGEVQSIAAVQSLAPRSGARIAGRLPAPRSDLTGVTLGNRAYLVGGYDGIHLAPDVLETADGSHFRVVTQIPVPVRYGAAAGLNGRLFVFGGQTGSGETSAIQEVNVGARRARIVGHLPIPLSHASAVVLGGFIYVLGGRANQVASRRIWSFDQRSGRVRLAGLLPMALSDAGVTTVGATAYLIGGEGAAGPTTAVIELGVATQSIAGFGRSEYPFNGRLLIADRGNNRLLLVDASRHVLWTYPSPHVNAPSGGFYYPDDAFFADHGRSVIVNEEGNQVVVRIAFPSGQLQWLYGHPGLVGSAPGYLHEPDDAYLLKNGQVVVADDRNCRVLFLSPAGRIERQIGTTGVCFHNPPLSLGSPNGDTPLANGDVLISEINGSWVSEYTPGGRLVWTAHLPITYPSDPQQIGPDRYLVADYASPGGLYEFDRSGTILWSYQVAAGATMLDHPSLAERLPNGLIAVSDDYRHRIVVINPVTQSIVWQFGQTDLLGAGSGLLNTPDGFDLLASGGQTPTHAATK
ncbi:MAG: hypothetical protein M3Z66_09530 [Chloroflexota bacterium]|nr:hypothetical protein [Chloroflexota bacterium]